MTTRRLRLLLAEGERDIKRGKGYALRAVLAEADALLATGRRPRARAGRARQVRRP